MRSTNSTLSRVLRKTSMSPELRGLYEVDRDNLPPLDEVKHRYSERRLLLADSVRLDSINIFGAAMKKEYCTLTEKDHLRMRMRAEVLATPDLAGRPFCLVSTMVGNREQAYGYSAVAFDTLQVKPGQWTTVSADFITPYILHRDDILSVSTWNAGGSPLQIRNVELLIYEPKSK